MLTAMGITVWRQRNTAPVVQPAPAPRFICVAQAAHADHDLLNNILKALSCTPEQAQIIWVEDPITLQSHIWPDVPVIVFGEILYPYTPETAIRTIPLNVLSQNVSAKKSLWQALKSLS